MSKNSIILRSKALDYYTKDYSDYIVNVKARSVNTEIAYRQDLKCFSKFVATSHESISELSEECITSYLKYLRQVQQLKPATVRRRLLTLQGFCQWLVVIDILKASPFDNLTLDLKVPKRLPRPVDPLMIRKLIMENRRLQNGPKSEKYDSKQITLVIIQLMITTGIRVGEATAIRVKDISSDGKTVHITGKGDKERLIYIENSQLAKSLSQYKRERILKDDIEVSLFVNTRGRVLTPQTIRKRVRSLCLDLGTSDTPTPHNFRHSAATLLIENGVDIRVVQRLLGHASISTTELYTQVSDVSLREALRKADVLSQFQ